MIILLLAILFQVQELTESERGGVWGVKRLVEYHQQIKRDMHVPDVYKLLYQAHFGVEHLLADREHVLSFLEKELASLDSSGSKEPLVERISTSDDMVRVNLRPYKALNLRPSTLVELMMESAKETVPDSLMFYRQWNEFSALVRYGLIRFSLDELKEHDERVSEGRLEPVHHSAEYAQANRPAYRVVRRELFERTFGNLK